MINVSNAFREKLEAGEPVRMVVDITFPDGTKKTIDDDIMNGDNGFSDCADSNSFPVGSAICKTLTFSINNDHEQWKDYDFYYAKIHAYLKIKGTSAVSEDVLIDAQGNQILDSDGEPIVVGEETSAATTEIIDKGVYTITTPEQYSDIITITALDDMYKANKAYTSGLKLPQSLINLVREACETLKIGMNFSMEHGDLVISSIPDNMTFRQLFGYAAMVESANARIDYSGNLRFIKWDFGKMESDNAATVDADGFIQFGDNSQPIDTENFVSLPGWTINAEGFLALTSGAGSDVQRLTAYANPPTLSSDDIVITGIRLKNGATNDDTDTDYSGMYGKEGYVLEIENELIDSDQLGTVASIIGEQLVGVRFRNLEGDLIYEPSIEFGDMVYTYDRLGNKYITPITDVSGNVGGLTTVKTQADNPIRGSSDYYSGETKAVVTARKLVKKETSAREEAIKRLGEKLSSTSGMYVTDETQADGSTIRYVHDKPKLAESQNVIKVSAEAIGFSNDGGKTYPYGTTLDGETITRILYAEGINADYINAGTLLVKNKSGNVIFQADMDTGAVSLDGNCVTIGGKNLNDKLTDVENAVALGKNIVFQLSNDYQAIPVDKDGNYNIFPECETTAMVMYGTQDISADCTYTVTTSDNVSGSWDSGSKTYTVTELTADSGWVDIRAVYLNNLTVTKRFSLAKQYAGAQGETGVDGRTYFLQSNAELLLMGADKKISPTTLTVSAFYRDGQGEAKSLSGYWKVEKSSDSGNSWSEIVTGYSTAVKTINIFANTLSLAAHDMIRTSVYFDTNKTILCDRQSFSVAIDVAALTQEDIVDILSNDGAWKGLYYLNGHLYISFDAAKGGTLILGGKNNGNGTQIIYNSSGNRVSKSDSDGTLYYKTYTDENNYTGFLLNKSGISYIEYANGVETLTPSIIDFTSSEKININSMLYVNGWANDGVRRVPVTSTDTDGTRVAYLSTSTKSNGYATTSEHGNHRLSVRGQWGETIFSTYQIYTNLTTSDVRLKDNIVDSEVNALEKVEQMRVRQFDWKEGGHQDIGFVADELEEIDPYLALGGGYDENGEMDIKQINSPYLLNYAIKAIQELSAKVEAQEKRIKELEGR